MTRDGSGHFLSMCLNIIFFLGLYLSPFFFSGFDLYFLSLFLLQSNQMFRFKLGRTHNSVLP